MKLNIELNEEIVFPLINELKKDTQENQYEVLNLLDIEADLKLLRNMHQILQIKNDNEIKKLAIIAYKILIRRVTNVMKNKKISCSKEEKKHIYKLYSEVLEYKPQKNRIKIKNY